MPRNAPITFWLAAWCVVFALLMAPNATAQSLPRPAETDRIEGRQPEKRVLLLHSYTARVRYTRVQDTAIREGVARGYHGNVLFFTTELDFNLEEDVAGWSSVHDFLKKRYESRQLDLIIATDTPAMRFLQRYGPETFPGVPMVFSASKEAPAEALREHCEITGVVETVDVRGTIELMHRFHPGTKRLLAITNSSLHGSELRETTLQALASMGNTLEVEWLDDLGFDDVVSRLKNAPQDSAVLFLTYWDISGKRSTLEGTLGEFTRVCPRPTYILYDTYLGYGTVGGRVASAEAYGQASAAIAVRVLSGERASNIPTVASFNPTLLDARQLRRFRIPATSIPADAQIRFDEPTFFERNSRIIGVASSVALIEGAIIGWLIISRRKLRKAQHALRASEERFRALGENLPGMPYTTLRMPDGRRIAEYLGPGLEATVGPEEAAKIRADFSLFFERIHPDDVGTVSAERADSLDHKRAFDAQYRLRTADGSYRWMRAIARPSFLDAGVVRWHGVLLDIDAAKQNEQALARRESILRAVADAGRLLAQAHDPLTTMNNVVRLLGSAAGADRAYLFDRVEDPALGWVNRMVAEWTNGDVPAQINDPTFAYLPDSAWERERWLAPLARGEAIVRATADCPEPERAYFESQGLKTIAIVPVIIPGRWWGFLGFDACNQATQWKDVEVDALGTAANAIAAALERRERDAKLREKDESLRRVAENIPGFIYRSAMSSDEMVRLEYVSPGFEDIFGQPPKWSPKPLMDLGSRYSAEDQEHAVRGMRRTAATLEPFDLVARVMRPDGGHRWVHIRATASRRGSETIFDGVVIDVTDRMIVEEALRSSEERYRLASLAGDDVVWDWDFSTGRIKWNEAITHVLGYPTVLRDTDLDWWAERIHPDDRERSITTLSGSAKDPGVNVWQKEYRFLHADGKYVDIFDRGYIVRDGEGRAVRAVGAMADVSARRIAERALRESEERYRFVVEALPVGLCVHDGERFLFANESLRTLLRTPTIQDVLDLPVARVIHADDLPHCAARAQDVLVENMCAGPREVRFIAVDGTPIEVEIRCTPLQYSGRRLIQTTVVDLRERKKTEAALRESEEKFRQITENAAEVFWLIDIETRMLRYVSPAFEPIWGVTRERIMFDPDSFYELVHQDDRARVKRTARGSVAGFDHEYRIVRPDGEVRWIRDRAYPVRDASGRTVRIAGVAEDITEAKAAEEALRHTSQTQHLLLSELDHRVKNSLSSLVTLIDLTRAATDDVHEFANSIRARVLAMASVHSLLSEGHWAPVLLKRVIRALYPPETVGTIEVDGPSVGIPARQVTALAMIVQELFTNSVKYGAAGQSAGLLSLQWSIENEGENGTGARYLHFNWHESGGLPIALPVVPGVGTRLIQGLCKFELNGEANFHYEANAVRHRFAFRLDTEPAPLPDPTMVHADSPSTTDFAHATLRNPDA